MSTKRKTICMVLMGDLQYDGRVRRESASLAQNGYNVTVITVPKRRESLSRVDGVRVKQMLLVTRRLFPQAKGLAFKYLEFVVRAATHATVQPASVYHAHDLPALLPAYIASRVKRARLVYDAHELWTETADPQASTQAWKRLERWLLRKIDGVITVNQSRARIIHEEYGARAKPVVVRNCPPCDHLPREKSGRLRQFVAQSDNSGPKIVLYQGSINPERGLDELVASVQHLNQGTVVVILGFSSPPDYVDNLKQKAAELGVQQRVLFHPPVPNAEILEYTRSADIGVVFYDDTCRNNRFCAPNKLYDYMMVGLPSVASDLPGIQEIVQAEEVGVTVDSTDPHAIASAINALLADEERYHRMSQQAMKLARERYNWESQERELLSLYKDMLSVAS